MGLSVLAAAIDPSSGLRIDSRSGSGFSIAMDSPPAGTSADGASPREVILEALAGCTAMDVLSILRKKRQHAERYEIAVNGETREDEHPHVFTRIVVEHRVDGAVEPEALRRAVELSATRYCPVSAMLSAAVTIEHRYRLRRQGMPEESALVLVTGPAA